MRFTLISFSSAPLDPFTNFLNESHPNKTGLPQSSSSKYNIVLYSTSFMDYKLLF